MTRSEALAKAVMDLLALYYQKGLEDGKAGKVRTGVATQAGQAVLAEVELIAAEAVEKALQAVLEPNNANQEVRG